MTIYMHNYSISYPYFSSSKLYTISRASCAPSPFFMKTIFDCSAAEPQEATIEKTLYFRKKVRNDDATPFKISEKTACK